MLGFGLIKLNNLEEPSLRAENRPQFFEQINIQYVKGMFTMTYIPETASEAV